MLARWPRALETLVDVPDCEQRVSVEGGETHQPRLRAAGQPLHQPQLSLPQRVGGVPDTAVNEPLRSFHNVHVWWMDSRTGESWHTFIIPLLAVELDLNQWSPLNL